MTTKNETQGEWLNGLACTSAGLTRKRQRRGDLLNLDLDTAVTTTATDEEIRAEFDAARARQPNYRQIATQAADGDRLSYSSAGATRRR